MPRDGGARLRPRRPRRSVLMRTVTIAKDPPPSSFLSPPPLPYCTGEGVRHVLHRVRPLVEVRAGVRAQLHAPRPRRPRPARLWRNGRRHLRRHAPGGRV